MNLTLIFIWHVCKHSVWIKDLTNDFIQSKHLRDCKKTKDYLIVLKWIIVY